VLFFGDILIYCCLSIFFCIFSLALLILIYLGNNKAILFTKGKLKKNLKKQSIETQTDKNIIDAEFREK